MNDPLVSVVMPTYNSAKFLSETIESVLSQTYKNLELLIVDDGSTDKTLSIANNFAIRDSRVKIFPLGVNWGGPAKPRNHGIKKAQGSYIAFLDSDDLWLPQKLQKQVSFLENNKDSFWLYSKFVFQPDTKKAIVRPAKPKKGYVFNDLLTRFGIIPILTVMIRNKKENNSYFFDEDKRLVAVEDYGMFLLIAKDEKISFIDEPLAIYRAHSTGISAGAYTNFKKCKLLLKKFTRFAPVSVMIRSWVNYYGRLAILGIVDTAVATKNQLRKRLQYYSLE